jgi:heat-inducible transcriptional repressor
MSSVTPPGRLSFSNLTNPPSVVIFHLLMDTWLTSREKTILEKIVRDFLLTGTPVSSGQLAEYGGFGLSSATIRNAMGGLESSGYLTRPHLSAGRVPTLKGLRYFLDWIMKVNPLSDEEIFQIEHDVSATANQGSLMREACRLLSTLSHYAGLVRPPATEALVFHRIEIFKIRDRKAVAILISASGGVHRTIFDLDENSTQDELNRKTDYMNRNMRGLTFKQVRERIEEEIRSESIIYYRMLMKILFAEEGFLLRQDEDLYIDGGARVLASPDRAGIGALVEVFSALDEKQKIISILDGIKKSGRTEVIFGDETGFAGLGECCIIASQFGRTGSTIGTVGLLGPRRMDYPRLVPLVDYTARQITKALAHY